MRDEPRRAAVADPLNSRSGRNRLLALGALFVAIPASVARGAGEMERPVASSLAWSALGLGAAVGAVL